jgi:hypothetical protein
LCRPQLSSLSIVISFFRASDYITTVNDVINTTIWEKMHHIAGCRNCKELEHTPELMAAAAIAPSSATLSRLALFFAPLHSSSSLLSGSTANTPTPPSASTHITTDTNMSEQRRMLQKHNTHSPTVPSYCYAHQNSSLHLSPAPIRLWPPPPPPLLALLSTWMPLLPLPCRYTHCTANSATPLSANRVRRPCRSGRCTRSSCTEGRSRSRSMETSINQHMQSRYKERRREAGWGWGDME